MAPKFQFDHPDRAIEALAAHLTMVTSKQTAAATTGRVLAAAVVADRPSPAADVSAMDGYAVRISDLQSGPWVPIRGESAPGSPAPELLPGSVVRIFTGAIVPARADAVVKREDTDEREDAIRFSPAAMQTSEGEHIRRSGENAQAGSSVIPSGTLISPAHRATMANFGCDQVEIYSPVRVSLLTTGDEVGEFEHEPPKPWQLRNSNRASIQSLLESHPWIKVQHTGHAKDQRETLERMISDCLSDSDALFLTGGVSMGNYDYVPDVIGEIGGEIVFHGLPIRPGKPVLGAATSDGKLILGLPGNPVSATVGCRRMAMPLLAKMSGQSRWQSQCPLVYLQNAGDKTIPLHWMRLVRLSAHGQAEAVISHGSGDLVSLGHSTGFVEVPQGASGEGPWPYYQW